MGDPGITTYRDIPGWFSKMDVLLFRAFLGAQASSPPGDLVEIGVFRGKSAVVIGDYLRPDERFVAVDIFGDTSLLTDTDAGRANAEEEVRVYPRVDRQAFEDNYLALHDRLPVVVQESSERVVDHVAPGSARFIHVDASHLYAGVAEDCRSVRKLLRPGGVVAFDDWRNRKCPGVAAAVWEAVITGGLVPVAVTKNKLYGVHDGAEQALDVVRAELARDPDWWMHDEHEIFGRTVLRLDNVSDHRRRKRQKQRRAARSTAGRPAPGPADRPIGGPGGYPTTKSWIGHELLPPLLLRRLQQRRRQNLRG